MTTPYTQARAHLVVVEDRIHRASMTDNKYATSGRSEADRKALRAAKDRVAFLVSADFILTTRERLGLSMRDLGEWLNPGVEGMERTIRRWEAGGRPVPGYIMVLVRLFAQGIKPTHIAGVVSHDG